jgi:hypothetical protein
MASSRANACDGTVLSDLATRSADTRRYERSIRLDLVLEMAGIPKKANYRFRF